MSAGHTHHKDKSYLINFYLCVCVCVSYISDSEVERTFVFFNIYYFIYISVCVTA